jgi:hypothetical protein
MKKRQPSNWMGKAHFLKNHVVLPVGSEFFQSETFGV